MNSIFKTLTICLTALILFVNPVIAKDLTVSIAKMPVLSETPEKGILIDFVKYLAEAEGIKIKIKVEPFPRSLSSLTNSKVDFQLPFSEMPANEAAKLDFAFSTETIFHVNFILYSNKNKNITPANVSKFKVETDRAHVSYFDFPIIPSSGIVSSLKKVNAGRIDAFIFAEPPTDPVLKDLKLTNIKRQLYKVFNVKMTIPKGKTGQEIDKILSSAVEKMRDNGMLAKTVGMLDTPYNNWQP